MKTLLYIDDNQAKIDELKKNFKSFNVIYFNNPLQAIQEIDTVHYHVLLIDIIMPFLDGFSLYEKIIQKESYQGQPIFFTSETNEEESMILALQRGTGELLTPDMPWSVKEQRILNKIKEEKMIENLNDEIIFDFATGNVIKESIRVPLTNTEILLLNTIYKNKGITKDDASNLVWGKDRIMAQNNLSTHLFNLNKKVRCLGVRAVSRKGGLNLIKLEIL